MKTAADSGTMPARRFSPPWLIDELRSLLTQHP